MLPWCDVNVSNTSREAISFETLQEGTAMSQTWYLGINKLSGQGRVDPGTRVEWLETTAI